MHWQFIWEHRLPYLCPSVWYIAGLGAVYVYIRHGHIFQKTEVCACFLRLNRFSVILRTRRKSARLGLVPYLLQGLNLSCGRTRRGGNGMFKEGWVQTRRSDVFGIPDAFTGRHRSRYFEPFRRHVDVSACFARITARCKQRNARRPPRSANRAAAALWRKARKRGAISGTNRRYYFGLTALFTNSIGLPWSAVQWSSFRCSFEFSTCLLALWLKYIMWWPRRTQDLCPPKTLTETGTWNKFW